MHELILTKINAMSAMIFTCLQCEIIFYIRTPCTDTCDSDSISPDVVCTCSREIYIGAYHRPMHS